jgi:hypothetical protein
MQTTKAKSDRLVMTVADFRKLKHRDFSNGAVLDEIEDALRERDRLLAIVERYVDSDSGIEDELTAEARAALVQACGE